MSDYRDGGSPMMIARAELRPQERLVWAEHPVRGTGRRKILPQILFGLGFSGFALFWMALAWGIVDAGGAWDGQVIDTIFPLFGLPFVLIGLSMVVAPFFRMRATARMVYALSNQRLLVISGGRTRRVQSYDLAVLGALDHVERPDGSGDLFFGGQSGPRSLRAGLLGVPNIRRLTTEIETQRRLFERDRRSAVTEPRRV